MDDLKVKFKHYWREIRWIFIFILWLISFLLGCWGFSIYGRENGFELSFLDIVYRTFQLISMNSGAVDGQMNWMLEIARFLMPAMTAYTAFFAIFNLFREKTQYFRLMAFRDHVIVCGLGRKGSRLVDDLLRIGRRVVVIEKNIDQVLSEEYRRKAVIVLKGDATDIEILDQARVKKASHLICLLGNDRENLKIALRAYEITRNKLSNKLVCVIHITAENLLNFVKKSEMNVDINDQFVLETFNVYHRAAIELLKTEKSEVTTPDLLQTNLLIIGFGRLGQNIVKKIGYDWYQNSEKTDRLQITIIDLAAEEKASFFVEQYPYLADSVTLVPIQIDVGSIKLLKKTIVEKINLSKIQKVYICLGDPILSVQSALTLNELPELEEIPFAVRLEKRSGLEGLLESPITGHFDHNNLLVFDPYEETCSANLVLAGIHELLAMKLRENYLQHLGTTDAHQKLKIKWKDVSEEEKEANRQQANRIFNLLNIYGYRANPQENWDAGDYAFSEEIVEKLAKMEHQLWCQWKYENGWRHDSVFDKSQKTHPDLKPWEELKESERRKNIDFIVEIPSMLAELGFQIDKTT